MKKSFQILQIVCNLQTFQKTKTFEDFIKVLKWKIKNWCNILKV